MEYTISESQRGLAMHCRLNLPGGLHARPAARLARTAQNFAADISIQTEDGEVDVKSMLDILSLALSGTSELTILANGRDARPALQEISALLESLHQTERQAWQD